MSYIMLYATKYISLNISMPFCLESYIYIYINSYHILYSHSYSNSQDVILQFFTERNDLALYRRANEYCYEKKSVTACETAHKQVALYKTCSFLCSGAPTTSGVKQGFLYTWRGSNFTYKVRPTKIGFGALTLLTRPRLRGELNVLFSR